MGQALKPTVKDKSMAAPLALDSTSAQGVAETAPTATSREEPIEDEPQASKPTTKIMGTMGGHTAPQSRVAKPTSFAIGSPEPAAAASAPNQTHLRTGAHHTPRLDIATEVREVPPRNAQARSIDYEDLSPEDASLLWQEALDRVGLALTSADAVLWLQLGGLWLPPGVERPVDVGIRFVAPDGAKANLSLVEPYEDVSVLLTDVGVSDEAGWAVNEMGCSLFAHGPLVLFSVSQEVGLAKTVGNDLLSKVAPPSLAKAMQTLVCSPGVQTAVRVVLQDGTAKLGLSLEDAIQRSGGKRKGKDLQALAVDLALGKDKLFDPFLIERVRQMFLGVGGATVVTSIECRADDPALVTMQLTTMASERAL